ncbi:MAG: DUF2802 domain-containing protein [Pseudomonadota bacterium]
MITLETLALMNAALLGLAALTIFSASRTSANSEVQASLKTQSSSELAMKQMTALRGEIGTLKSELNQLMCSTLESKGSTQEQAELRAAASMASGGMSATQIAESCGISPAEAQLVIRMRQAKA